MDELSDWQGQMKSSNLISLDEYTEAGSEVKMRAWVTHILKNQKM